MEIYGLFSSMTVSSNEWQAHRNESCREAIKKCGGEHMKFYQLCHMMSTTWTWGFGVFLLDGKIHCPHSTNQFDTLTLGGVIYALEVNKHHWPTTTNRVIQPNILELLYFGNYINYHICLSFKSIMLTTLFAKLEKVKRVGLKLEKPVDGRACNYFFLSSSLSSHWGWSPAQWAIAAHFAAFVASSWGPLFSVPPHACGLRR